MDQKDYMREYYHRKDNAEKIRAQVRKYRREHPDAVLRTRLKTHAKNPSKINARRVVYEAVRAGVLNKPDTCSKCGRKNCRIEAHHNDHTKPFDVIWLCPSCHRKLDAKMRKEAGITMKPSKARKLTDDQVREIRSSDLSYSQLSKKYGVSINVLQKIKHYQTYKDVK